MLEIAAIVLLVAWLLAFGSAFTLGGYANLLLVVALVLVVAGEIRRRPRA